MGIKKTIEMVRSGEFDIETFGRSHCGTSSAFAIRYHLECECSSRLDSRGFLFDQLNIQNFFDSIKRTQLSCEQLTVACCEQLLSNILTENPGCQIYRQKLTLSPAPFMATMSHILDGDNTPLIMASVPNKLKKLPAISESGKVHKADHSHNPSHPYVFVEP